VPSSPDGRGRPGGVGEGDLALFTDLYEITMAAAYHRDGLDGEATFDLFVRDLPPQRGYLVVAGIDRALSYLEGFAFSPAAVDYLRGLGFFGESFLEHLSTLRFTGEVWAIPEGEVAFAEEPLLSVTAPLMEAQLVETFLLNAVAHQTMIASKASRIATACGPDRSFVDFSPRRDHGTDAAIQGARASVLGGATGTSLVLAGAVHGLELSGTMAHSYVMRHASEEEAFRSYARAFPGRTVLLIDTYDTLEGARRAARVAGELAPEGIRIAAVRLDSGDLDRLSREVRAVLDDAGHPEIGIFASGDLDEHRIAALVGAGAPIDGFGVGTQLGTSADAPSLGAVYKLVADAGGPRMKLSEGKVSFPGRKQVYRDESGGEPEADLLALRDEAVEGGRPLLGRVMAGGRRLVPPEPLEAARERHRAAVEALPARLRALQPARPPYPVRRSPGLEALMHDLASAYAAGRGA